MKIETFRFNLPGRFWVPHIHLYQGKSSQNEDGTFETSNFIWQIFQKSPHSQPKTLCSKSKAVATIFLRTLEVYGNTDRGNQKRCGKFVLYYSVTHLLVRKYKLLNQVGTLFQYCRLTYLPSCLLACVGRSILVRKYKLFYQSGTRR